MKSRSAWVSGLSGGDLNHNFDDIADWIGHKIALWRLEPDGSVLLRSEAC
jgi:hypothetical protein